MAIAEFEAMTHHHGLSGGGAFIQHGGVGYLQAGEISDDGLKIQQGLQPALRNLGLVRGVGGVPTGIF